MVCKFIFLKVTIFCDMINPGTHYFIIVQVNENLFSCQLSNEKTKLAEEAVQLAVKTWGLRSLSELEAEERLSYCCEKVNFFVASVFFFCRSTIQTIRN